MIRAEWYGTMLAALSASLLGFVAFLGTALIHDHFSISSMLFWRFITATLFLVIFIACSNKKLIAGNALKTHAHDLIGTAVLYGAAASCYFVSAKIIDTGLSVAIFFSFPMFVVFLSCLFSGFKLDKLTVLALIAIFTGIALIHGRQAQHIDGWGVFFALLSAFLYATYICRSRIVGKVIPPIFLTTLVCTGCSIIFFIFANAIHKFTAPHHLQDWLYILALGGIGTALPIQLLLESLKYISPVKASILASLQVVVTVLMGSLFLGEQLSTWQSLGIISLIFGAIIIQKNNARPA